MTTGRIVPAIAVTAHTSHEVETRARAEGFRAFIRKPYQFEELVSAVADAARSVRETTTDTADDPTSPKILIVDDDEDQLQILSAALEGHYEVFTASDGLDGYAIACRERPAVAVLDIMMPLVDGWTVMRKIRANPLTKDTRIVIATALDGESVSDEAAKLNVSLILRKPLISRQLKTSIGRLSDPDSFDGRTF